MAQGIRPRRRVATLGLNLESVRARLLAGALAVVALGASGAAIERTADAVAVTVDAEPTTAAEETGAEVEKTRATDGADAGVGLPNVDASPAPRGSPIVHDPRPGEDATVRIGGRAYKPVGTMRMRVTAYSPDARSCGKFADGITASGKRVTHNGGFLVAADTRLLPFGTMVSVPGYFNGWPVPVLDRGGAIKGRRLDVLFDTHARARRWGVQHLDVVVWREVPEP